MISEGCREVIGYVNAERGTQHLRSRELLPQVMSVGAVSVSGSEPTHPSSIKSVNAAALEIK